MDIIDNKTRIELQSENFEWFKKEYENISKKNNKKYYIIQNKKVIANFDIIELVQQYLYTYDKKSDMFVQSEDDLNLRGQNRVCNH